jgi:hypothetical protein
MGTSKDRDGGSGGNWSPYKRAATDYAKGVNRRGGDPLKVDRVLGRHVAVLGGVAGATSSATTGRRGLASLAGLLSGISGQGLVPTLQQSGLGHLVGQERFDVLDQLVTAITGDGSDLESQAARDALCDVFEELFAEDADSWNDLEVTSISEEQVVDLLEMFLAHYIHNRLPVLPERLARLLDHSAVNAAESQLIETIRGYVNIHLPPDPLNFDWGGPDGAAFAEAAMQDIYSILHGLAGDE